jgi:DNA-3-methyladenine glycosylase II
MIPIDSEHHLEVALAQLVAADPQLAPLAQIAGPLPLRRRTGGFEGLAFIVTSQQISTAAAAPIWARLAAAVDPFTPERLLATSEETLRAVGLSRPKVSHLRNIAAALADGFDLDALHDLPAEEAMTALRALRGVGPWTAEIYLLFCIGHPDIFPAGDLALQSAVQRALGLDERPKERALRALAGRWAPWRGVAARLFWAYYRAKRNEMAQRSP